MILSIAFFFVVAYLAGVWGLVWFNLHVLDLGDPKFRNADVGFYFIPSAAFWLPAVITAIVFLSRARQDEEWRLRRLAGIYLALIFAAVELFWLFNLANSLVLLVGYATLGFLFWKVRVALRLQAMPPAGRFARMNEQRAIEALEAHGGSWRDCILVGDPPAISRFTPPVKLMGLVIEDDVLYRECVEFLRSRGARYFPSADDVKRTSGGRATVEQQP